MIPYKTHALPGRVSAHEFGILTTLPRRRNGSTQLSLVSYTYRPTILSTPLLALVLLAAPQSVEAPDSTVTDTPNEALARADSLRLAGRYGQARDLLMELRRSEAPNLEVLWRLVHTEVELGEHRYEGTARKDLYQSAFAHAETALAADSTDPRAHLAQALAAGRLAQTVDSQRRRLELSRLMKRRADRALDLDPKSHLAHYLLGRWHFELASIGTMTRLAARAVYGGIPSASLEAAARHVRRAVELEERIAYRLTLARILRAQEELAPAAEHLAALLDLPAKLPGDEHRKERARTLLAEIRTELEGQQNRQGWFGISL